MCGLCTTMYLFLADTSIDFPQRLQHLINVHVGEVYVYVCTCYRERAIQLFNTYMYMYMHIPCICQADRQTCREEQSIHTVLCVLLSAVYEYRNTHMYMFIYVHTYVYMYVRTCTRTLPYNKVGRLSMAAIRGW